MFYKLSFGDLKFFRLYENQQRGDMKLLLAFFLLPMIAFAQYAQTENQYKLSQGIDTTARPKQDVEANLREAERMDNLRTIAVKSAMSELTESGKAVKRSVICSLIATTGFVFAAMNYNAKGMIIPLLVVGSTGFELESVYSLFQSGDHQIESAKLLH